MATTITSEVKILPVFNYNAKTVTVQFAGDLTGTNLSNITPSTDLRALVQIVDPDGDNQYLNTNTASPDITATASATFDNTALASSVFTLSSHGYSTGQPVLYDKGSGGTAPTGLTDLTTYYVIKLTTDTFSLASSFANAMAGTVLTVTDGSMAGTAHIFVYSGASFALPSNSSGDAPQSGQYEINLAVFDSGATSTLYARSIKVDFDMTRPTISLDISHSVVNPIFLKSVDETNYEIDGVTPSIVRDHKLYHPAGNGSKTVTTKTLNTNVFYTKTSQLYLQATTNYAFADAFYTDDTSVKTISWQGQDVFSGTQDYTVDGANAVSDKYSCMKNMWDRVQTSRTTNRGKYDQLLADFNQAEANYTMLDMAINTGNTEDANGYALEIQRLTGCNDTTDVTQVVGIGATTNIDRKVEETLSADSTKWTPTDSDGNAVFVGYDDEEVIFFIDGEHCDPGASVDILRLNSANGTATFSATVTSGQTITGWIIKP